MDSSPFEENPHPAHNGTTPRGNPLYLANGTSPAPPPNRQLFPQAQQRGRATARSNAATTQPSYDFLAPAATPPAAVRTPMGPPRSRSQSMHKSARAQSQSPAPGAAAASISKSDHTNETLRAELNSLRYELSTLREERALEKIRTEQEQRTLEAKCETAGKRADEVETEKRFLFDKQTDLADKLQKVKDQATKHKQDLERQVRMLKSENSNLKELFGDKQDELDTMDRENRRKINEYETRTKSLTQTNEELRAELEQKSTALAETQSRLSEKEIACENLGTSLQQSKSQSTDLETLPVLKKELSEQVAHIKTLENTIRKQAADLKNLKEHNKSIEVLQEEKAALESKLSMMDSLRDELSNVHLRLQILQDERAAWSSYLTTEGLEFDSPAALARALIQERVEHAGLLEQAGRTIPALAEKDERIRGLEEQTTSLENELKAVKVAAEKEAPARQRLERQRALALKEAAFLREQLASFQTEESLYAPGGGDAAKTARITELEALLDNYKTELDEARGELARLVQQGNSPANARKRPREDDDEEAARAKERVAELSRRNRTLEEETQAAAQRITLLEKDLAALQGQLATHQASRGRILELRDNPAARHMAVQQSTLDALSAENRALLAQLEGRTPAPASVPLASLEAARRQIDALEKTVAEKEKRMERLKQIFGAKSTEFREAVFSLLGWKLDFMPNGRVRISHMFARASDDESIEFDGEKGTMKVAGGSDGAWGKEIRNMCAFWMQRQSIPCLLASILIEQYEKTTRAQM